MYVAGITKFNQVVYDHMEKCIVCMWQELPCLIKCYMFTRRSVLYMCGGDDHVL